MKSYDEVARNVFERRDKYAAKQKKKKRIIISTAVPALCCCIALITGFGLQKSGVFGNNIPAAGSMQSPSYNSSANNKQSRVTSGSKPYSENNSANNSSEENSVPDSTISSEPDSGVSSAPDKTPSSKPSGSTPSTVTPGTPTDPETGCYIDSLDKINFYSAKKIISEKSLLPIKMNSNGFFAPSLLRLSNTYAEYPIDRDRIFTATMVTYFTSELNDKKGFLAQKLGGTGFAEVVVTENDIEDMGQMITFKREDNYYTCFMNTQNGGSGYGRVSREFSSHKYIEGFNIVKNLDQENYKFTVRYEGSKVVGFECAPFNSTPENYAVDDVTFIEDFCVVIYTKQTFTIDELEAYFKNENKGELL